MSLKQYFNKEFNLDVIIDYKQNVYFKGSQVASLLGYEKPNKAILDHVDVDDKLKFENIKGVPKRDTLVILQPHAKYITESGLYSLIFGSKLGSAKRFKRWVCADVLPSIRKYGYYKMFDNIKTLCFKIEDEYDLHTKIGDYLRRFHPNVMMIAGLGELQTDCVKRIDSWKKGYQKGQPDLIISSLHKIYTGFCIELKTPKRTGVLSDAQRVMLKKYRDNGYKTLVSCDYDVIVRAITVYCKDLRVKCKYCKRKFISVKTRRRHHKYFHKIIYK